MAGLTLISSRLPVYAFHGQLIKRGGGKTKTWTIDIAFDSLILKAATTTISDQRTIFWQQPTPNVQNVIDAFLSAIPKFKITLSNPPSNYNLSLSETPLKNCVRKIVLQGQYDKISFEAHVYPHNPKFSYGTIQGKEIDLDLSELFDLSLLDWKNLLLGKDPFCFQILRDKKIKLMRNLGKMSTYGWFDSPNNAKELSKSLSLVPEKLRNRYLPLLEEMATKCLESKDKFQFKFLEILYLWSYLALAQKMQLWQRLLEVLQVMGLENLHENKLFHQFLKFLKQDTQAAKYLSFLNLDRFIDPLITAALDDLSHSGSCLARLRLVSTICELLLFTSCQVKLKNYDLSEKATPLNDLQVKKYWLLYCHSLLQLLTQGTGAITPIIQSLSQVNPLKGDKQAFGIINKTVNEFWRMKASLHAHIDFPKILILRLLINFFPELLLRYDYFKKKLNPTMPYFVVGYTDILGEDLLQNEDIDISFAKHVIHLLLTIRKERGGASQTTIDAYLEKATKHPQKAVQSLAKESFVPLPIPPEDNFSLDDETKDDGDDNLFDSAFSLSAPMDCLIKRTLKDFGNLFSMESKYYIEQRAQESLAPAQFIGNLLDDFLLSSHKVLLITGRAGSGKSMCLKQFFEKQLTLYAEGITPYLPLFFSLVKLNQINALKDKCLKSNFDKSVEFERVFKQKTVWIFDGYDEIAFEEIQNQIQIKNLYALNNLMHVPSAKFIFTCREGFCSPDFFKPEREATLQHIRINTFESSTGDIGKYIDNYLALQAKLKPDKNAWTLKEYSEALETLMFSSASSLSQLSQPHLLKVLIHALPSIMQKLEDKLKKTRRQILNDARLLEELTQEMYDLFTCANIERAWRRQNLESVDKNAFLWYALAAARAMQISRQTNLYLQEAKKDPRCIQAIEAVYKLISQADLVYLDKNEFFGDSKMAILFRTSTLVLNKGNYWTFADPAYYQHLISAIENNRIQDLIKIISEDPYGVQKLVLFV